MTSEPANKTKDVEKLPQLTDEDYRRIQQYLDDKLPDSLLAQIVEE